MNATVVVTVHLKEGVRDPAGEAVEAVLAQMGFPVANLRIGRQVVLEVQAPNPAEVGEAVAAQLLANPVLETYQVEVRA
jgi:phosphoribosylformylglycinamidine synthase